jgi:hypothetical protein
MEDFQRFIGKRVTVTAPIGRDNAGRRNGSNVVVAGTCDSLGPNKHLEIPLQIVVDRMPITVNSVNQVQMVQ